MMVRFFFAASSISSVAWATVAVKASPQIRACRFRAPFGEVEMRKDRGYHRDRIDIG